MVVLYRVLLIGGFWLGLAMFLAWCFGTTAKQLNDPENGPEAGKGDDIQ